MSNNSPATGLVVTVADVTAARREGTSVERTVVTRTVQTGVDVVMGRHAAAVAAPALRFLLAGAAAARESRERLIATWGFILKCDPRW